MARLEERDLRSLERKSMYSIFAPLDVNERLPRELLLESRRYRLIGRPEVAGLLWLPALFIVLMAMGWLNAGTLIALGVISLLFAAFCVYARSGKRNAP